MMKQNEADHLNALITLFLQSISPIYTNLQQAEPSKFKNLNDNKMTRRVIGEIVHILKSIYLHAYPNKAGMGFYQICKVFLGIFFI